VYHCVYKLFLVRHVRVSPVRTNTREAGFDVDRLKSVGRDFCQIGMSRLRTGARSLARSLTLSPSLSLCLSLRGSSQRMIHISWSPPFRGRDATRESTKGSSSSERLFIIFLFLSLTFTLYRSHNFFLFYKFSRLLLIQIKLHSIERSSFAFKSSITQRPKHHIYITLSLVTFSFTILENHVQAEFPLTRQTNICTCACIVFFFLTVEILL
jgi:hypothetical protein